MMIVLFLLFTSFFTQFLSGVDKKEIEVLLHIDDNRMTDKDKNVSSKKIMDRPMIATKKELVHKAQLKNGMTILVKENHQIPRVSLQLWYHVGSKDEKDKERGIAHLIEHMIFKGTSLLSESDINTITHMLSGSCNAFTSYDYTGYLFNMPTQNWQTVLPIMADCMTNCSFKQDMLNSEMKAVIQELKMYKDFYNRIISDELISIIFADHPYHHPIIGYKQDLWTVKSDDLRAFYKKHYLPNNATLVVVGDVHFADVVAQAEKNFGAIPADKNYKKEQFYFNQDIAAKSVTLYRDIQQPIVVFAYVVPGVRSKKDRSLMLLELILGKGKSSRLYKKLVDELQLATSVEASADELFDYGLFTISCHPKQEKDIEQIRTVITQEIEDIAECGVSDEELLRAINQEEMSIYDLLENTEQQAYLIGKYYLATGDPEYIFNCLNAPIQTLKQEIHEIVRSYLRSCVMHSGLIMPLQEKDHERWTALQHSSDLEDERFLSARPRTSAVEPASYAHKIAVNKPINFSYPKPSVDTIENGLKLFWHNNDATPKINLILSFKARDYYDPIDKQGLYLFLSRMLSEGTKKYTGAQLADLIESRGMSLDISPGTISMSMKSDDLPFGLEILHEILTSATFDAAKMEKVRKQLFAQLKSFWDDPWVFAQQLVREKIYHNHPYSKNIFGTESSLKAITRDDLIDFYKKNISPVEARLAIVGDLKGYDVVNIVKKHLGDWQGQQVPTAIFPTLNKVTATIIDHPMNRDQIVLYFAGLSVGRKDPNYDKLRLFDQIFGSGELGSMSSRLFDLREQSGLFYTINGSLVARANEQPGMVLVKTIVSRDRLDEAQVAIKKTIDTAIKDVSSAEFSEAKDAIINSLVNHFATNEGTAEAFLFVDRYDLPRDFFDNRVAEIEAISLTDMKKAVESVLSSDKMLTLRIGRLVKEATKKQEK